MLPSFPHRYFPYQQKDKRLILSTTTTTGSAYINPAPNFAPSVPFTPLPSVLTKSCSKYTNNNMYQSTTQETYKPFINQPPCCKYVNTPRCSIYGTNFKLPIDFKPDYFTTVHNKEYSRKLNDNIPPAGKSLNLRPRDQGRVMLTNTDDTSFEKGSEYDQSFVKHSINGREDCLYIVEKMNKDNVKRGIEAHNSSVFSTTAGDTFQNTLKLRERTVLSCLALDEKGGVCNIPFGDQDKFNSYTSQHQDSYNVDNSTNAQTSCYDKKKALSNVYQSSILLGDAHHYGGLLSESVQYPNHGEQEKRPSIHYDRNKSSFPPGDLVSQRVKERMSYLSSSAYAKPPPGSFPTYIDLSHLHTHSNIHFGGGTTSSSQGTTSVDTYKPLPIDVCHAQPPPDSMKHVFCYKAEKPFTSTAKEFYDKKELTLRSSNQSNLKESHWKLPYMGVSFKTTHQSHYTAPPSSLVVP